MRKTQAIAVFLCVSMFGLSALWGKGKDKQPTKPIEETYLGPISCTVTTFKEAAPIPVGNVPLQNAGNNAVPQTPGKNANNAPPQTPGNNAAPQNAGDNRVAQAPDPNALPQPPGLDATAPIPAQNLSVSKPVVTFKDCLSHGGLVAIVPDGSKTPIIIDNPDVIKGHEWHRLSLSGYMKGAVFHIISVRVI
jgi:hypothetical protein